MLILDGVVIRRAILGERHSADILGAGDLIRPFEAESEVSIMVPTEVTWRALEPLTLALLDEHFEQEMCAYPEVIAELIGRIARRSGVQAERLAIIQQPRLTARLHFLLWQLADDFGRVERGGVVLSLRLSHSVLADLVSAQRPSVSHALKQLERHGLVGRRSNGYWWLAGRPPEGLADFAEATRARA